MMNEELNIVELNAILYYADFLSMQELSIPVTDTCKYFFVHQVPMNACYIADVEPIFDPNNKYFKQSRDEFTALRDKFGDDGAMSFIEDISSIRACGCVSGERMLQCIHRYSPRKKYEKALQKYTDWKNGLIYKHIIKDDDGKSIVANCSKEIAHVEASLGLPIESNILKGSELHVQD